MTSSHLDWLKTFVIASSQSQFSMQPASSLTDLTSIKTLSQNLHFQILRAQHDYNCHQFRQSFLLSKQIVEADPFEFRALLIYIGSMVEMSLKSDLFYVAHQAVQAFAKHPISWYAVACYYLLQGRLDLARSFFAKSTEIDPRFVPSWIGFGHAFAAQDESDQALGAYRTAARLCPGSHIPSLCLGSEYSRIGNIAQASKHLNQALSCCADPLIYHELGVIAFKAGDYQNSLQFFEKCIASRPGLRSSSVEETWLATYINIGHCHRKLEHWDAAIQSFHQALSMAPSNIAIFSALALTHHMQGSIDTAISFYHKGLCFVPNDAFLNQMLNRALEDNVTFLSVSVQLCEMDV
jgi:anaphase-promoting complex subunit 6